MPQGATVDRAASNSFLVAEFRSTNRCTLSVQIRIMISQKFKVYSFSYYGLVTENCLGQRLYVEHLRPFGHEFYVLHLGSRLVGCGLSAKNAVHRTSEGSCLKIGGWKTP